MRPEKWWSVILTMALFMVLIPLSAQAGPHRAVGRHVNRQAFHRPQPRAFANRRRSQPHRWQQPRGNAYGWHGRNRQWQQPRGHAYGWNAQPRQWQQRRHNTYGWNGRPGPWQQRRNAYGQNDHRRQWQSRNVYGHNDRQRQWQQPRSGIAQGDRRGNRQFHAPNVAQQNNPGNSYNRVGYPSQAQSPNIAPRSSGSYPNAKIPAGQFSRHSGFRRSHTSGNASQPQGHSPSGGI
jgi:hypothetical protein